jgi:hypothetical protein
MRQSQSSPSGKHHEVVGIALRGVGDRSGCGESGIGEKLGFRIPDWPGGPNGIGRQAGRDIGLSCTKSHRAMPPASAGGIAVISTL